MRISTVEYPDWLQIMQDKEIGHQGALKLIKYTEDQNRASDTSNIIRDAIEQGLTYL